MEPKIYKPSIYTGAGIYKTGAGGGGGGGVHPKLIYGVSPSDLTSGWRFGNNTALCAGNGGYHITTGLSTYALCPYINTAKKIYVKYKINYASIPANKSILDTDFDIGYRLFTNWCESGGTLSFYLKNGSSTAHSFLNYANLTLNTDILLEHELDIENAKFTTKLNGSIVIDSTINLSALNLQRYNPAWGILAQSQQGLLPKGTLIDRNEFSYMIDGVEQIPQETLD